jgi:hypothetical protein
MAVSRDPGKGDQLGSASFWRMFFFIIKKNSFFLNSQVKPQGLGSSRSWKDFSLSFFFFFSFFFGELLICLVGLVGDIVLVGFYYP